MPISPATLDRCRLAMAGQRRTWLVTGVAGFIGANLAEALLLLDQEVVGFDNFSTGSQRNLDDVCDTVGADAFARFRFIEGDIRESDTCRSVCAGVDVVLHHAALGSVPRSLKDPIATNQSNVDGFLNMLVAARDAGVRRFVYAASSSTYGDSPRLPKVEHDIGRPLSPYAVTKLVNELYADVFARSYGLESIGLRYFNVFGPRQDPAGAYAAVIPRWIEAMLHGRECTIYGDGLTTRDFCYVDNAVQANVLAAVTVNAAAIGQVYNIAVGGRTSLVDLHQAIRDRLAALTGDERIAGTEPSMTAFREGDVRHSQADISRARELLGYQPTHDLRQGLDQALPWYVAHVGGALR